MRIGIDCRLSGLNHAGIGRYIENLTRRLPKLNSEIDWVYFYADNSQLLDLPSVETHLVPIKHYSFDEQYKLPRLFKKAQLDLLHVPHFNAPLFYNGPLVVTIHDLLWHQQRGRQVTTLKPWVYWPKYVAYRLIAAQSVKSAQKILVPTETIKETLCRYYPAARHKITVTYEGVDQRLLGHHQADLPRDQRRLLYVGSLYPHKNLGLVLQSLLKLPEWQLTIVSARDVFHERLNQRVKELGLENQVVFTGRLSDVELAEQLQTCTALVQPSLSEGFGLTGLEALSLDTPVLASDIAIFHEVYREAAHYFDPHNPDDLVQSLKKLQTQPPQPSTMQAVVANYSWDKLAEKTLQTYLEVLNHL